MMHRCSSSSQGNMVGPCSCGLFHSQSNSFSMLFSTPNHKPFDHDQSAADQSMYSFTSPSSSVDCTLSLGTPSTRLSNEDMRHERRGTDSCVPNFCWDLLQNKHNNNSAPSSYKNGSSRGGSNSNCNNSGSNANDPLLARRCANCDTTSTPLWRNGPRGPKSLCNACGIRFKKEERRATAAAATSTANGAASGLVMDPSQMFSHHNNSWIPHSQTQKMPCLSPAIGNEFRFLNGDDNHEPADTGISFLSWRLNVTDRPSLVHDFTR